VLEFTAPQINVGAPARQRLRPPRQAEKRVRQWHWEAVLLVDGVKRGVRELASEGARQYFVLDGGRRKHDRPHGAVGVY